MHQLAHFGIRFGRNVFVRLHNIFILRIERNGFSQHVEEHLFLQTSESTGLLLNSFRDYAHVIVDEDFTGKRNCLAIGLNCRGDFTVFHFPILKFIAFRCHQFRHAVHPKPVFIGLLEIWVRSFRNEIQENSWLLFIGFQHHLVSEIINDRNELVCPHRSFLEHGIEQVIGVHEMCFSLAHTAE